MPVLILHNDQLETVGGTSRDRLQLVSFWNEVTPRTAKVEAALENAAVCGVATSGFSSKKGGTVSRFVMFFTVARPGLYPEDAWPPSIRPPMFPRHHISRVGTLDNQ